MSKMSEAKIIEKFREHIKHKSLTDNVKLTYRLSGGMPSQRIEEEFRLSGSGKSKVVFRDILRSVSAQEAFTVLNQSETRDLFEKISSGLDSLTARSEARFLPDSVVGSITVQVGRQKATLFFPVETEGKISQQKSLAPEISKAIKHIKKISQPLIKKGKEKGNE